MSQNFVIFLVHAFNIIMNLSYKGTFTQFVFIPCLVAKAADNTRGSSTILATKTVADVGG